MNSNIRKRLIYFFCFLLDFPFVKLYNQDMNAKTIIKNHQKFNNLPFHIERFCPTEPIQLHYHDCVELILCTGGEALYHIEDTCFQPGEGSLYIIGEYPAHSLSDFNNFESYRILFDMSMLECLDDEIKTSSGFF